MYILKNALRSVSRSKGRNILIGIIILVIAVSSCVALSIREAADKARKDSMAELEVTAQISVDRQSLMQGQQDKESMKDALSNMQELSLEDLETYADSNRVKDFYYTGSISLNGSDEFEAVDTTGASDDSSGTTTEESTTEKSDAQSTEGGPGQMGPGGDMGQTDAQEGQSAAQGMKGGRMGIQGDFTVTGYSSDSAMTGFVDGSQKITSGSMFAEGDTDNQCVISQDLATYNGLSVGDTITVTNPNKEEETYSFTVCGIYESTETEDSAGNMMGGFSAANDAANQIYTSYDNLKTISDASTENAETTTDENTGMETTTALQMRTTGTYAFTDVKNYEAFKKATEKKLGDGYVVSSNDVSQYEQSLVPLENLSKYAGYFLIIVLIIGGIILVVLNIFNIRERKYEIGVLAAIGMKKGRIALQFITELLVVTCIAIVIGAGVGAAASVPVTNKLLEQQVESSSSAANEQEQNFGRGAGAGGQGMPDRNGQNMGAGTQATNYISKVNSATDVTVILELIGIGLLLTILSGCVAIIFILRYDPLRILSSRD